MNRVQSVDAVEYGTRPFASEDDAVISNALSILARRIRARPVMDAPAVVRDYLKIKLNSLEHEVFGVMFLDAHLCLIQDQDMFRGTLTQTSVYPREVVKEAIKLNAAAVILYHDHPSGKAEPSRADEHLTCTLKSALALIDVRIIDHLVVAGVEVTSFAERGLL